MSMFGTDCSGGCKDCHTYYSGGCLAGHGDDEFIRITIEGAMRVLGRPTGITESKEKQLREKFPELDR